MVYLRLFVVYSFYFILILFLYIYTGAGKSTLLKIIAGIDTFYEGTFPNICRSSCKFNLSLSLSLSLFYFLSLSLLSFFLSFSLGEAIASKGVKVGYLAQEPDLDPDKTVKENIIDGVKSKKAVLDKYEQVCLFYYYFIYPFLFFFFFSFFLFFFSFSFFLFFFLFSFFFFFSLFFFSF